MSGGTADETTDEMTGEMTGETIDPIIDPIIEPTIDNPRVNFPAPTGDRPDSTPKHPASSPNPPNVYSNTYVWAVGEEARSLSVGERVGDRYRVVSPQLWEDTRPHELPQLPAILPSGMLPYLYLARWQYHLPQVYGCSLVQTPEKVFTVLLLTNVPCTLAGHLCPSLTEVWGNAPERQRLYWLWQILTLWPALAEQSVTTSVLELDNIRVEGGRVRLRELLRDPETVSPRALGHCWTALQAIQVTDDSMGPPVLNWLIDQLQTEDVALPPIVADLYEHISVLTSQFPLTLEVAGGTRAGPHSGQNEDWGFPLTLTPDYAPPALVPYLSIVCDGLGGHERGAIASQIATKTLQLQVQALLAQHQSSSTPPPPPLFCQQLAAGIRVVNNLLAAQNDTQGYQDRQRMGTTMVMAFFLPTHHSTRPTPALPNGGALEDSLSLSYELYLAHVGDSRAYWITPHHCQLLTVDDTMAVKRVTQGQIIPVVANQQDEGGALTAVMGLRKAELGLEPTVQSFLLQEDGLLLLCSDGLSDYQLLEQLWPHFAAPVLAGEVSLDEAVLALLELARRQNGHDDVTVVLTRCRVVTALSPSTTSLSSVTGSSEIGESETGWSEIGKSETGESETGEYQENTPVPEEMPTGLLGAIARLTSFWRR